jgi:uncharacterized membrane protein YjgN (DUF898 family)
LIFKRYASEEAAGEAAERFRGIGMVLEIQAVAPKKQAAPSSAVRTAAQPAPVVREMATVAQAPPKMASSATEDRQAPFVFSGNGSEFFKIWIVNVFLSILTLGIYSAWAKVRTLRYFYGNTSLDGSAFEYLAEPIKILKGRLIVVAFLAVFSLTSKFYPMINLLFWPVVLLLTPWVVRQSLRFRYHYTAWRGVRFTFAGGLWDAAKSFVLWPIVGGMLFFLMPFAWHRQTHYLAENSRFGAASFENRSTVEDFFKMLGILLLFALVMGLVAAVVFFMGRSLVSSVGLPSKESTMLGVTVGAITYLVIASIIAALYKVRMINLRFGKTNIGPHQIVSSYASGSYLTLVITNTLAIMFTLGLFYPFAKVRTARYAADHTAMIINGDLDGFVADRQTEVSALGSETGDFLDIDIGF